MNNYQKKPIRITYNAPVTLTFVLICVGLQVLSLVTGGASNRLLFSVYRSSFGDPLAYLRVFGHVFGHSGWNHLLNNAMYLLILGPMLEEKYGSRRMIIVIAITAFFTGLCSLVLAPHIRLMGASSLVFAMILLSSITVTQERTIPLSFILVALLYIGQQIYQGITVQDNVSQLSHIAGGLTGSAMGFIMNNTRLFQLKR